MLWALLVAAAAAAVGGEEMQLTLDLVGPDGALLAAQDDAAAVSQAAGAPALVTVDWAAAMVQVTGRQEGVCWLRTGCSQVC